MLFNFIREDLEMKKIITLLFTISFIVSGVNVIGTSFSVDRITNSSSLTGNIIIYNIDFPSIDKINIQEKDENKIIRIDDFNYLNEIGKPRLPAKNYLFALPPNSKVKSLEYSFEDLTEIPGFYNIEPVEIMIPLDFSPKLFNDLLNEWKQNYNDIYNFETTYPLENGKIDSFGTFRQYPYVSVSICPFQYHPKSGTLNYFRSVEITITYEKTYNEFFKNSLITIEKAKKLFTNYDQIEEFYQPPISESSTFDDYDYLIITSETLVETVENSEFFNWKTALGYNIKSVLVTDNEITSQPGIDLAEKIRNFLRENYLSWGVEFVLLVGDYTTVPMRYCSPNPYWLEGTVPTDTYYADLSYPDSESWNSNDDNYYGVYGQDNPDFVADVYVGRIPTSDISKLEYTLEKITTFEKDTGDWKDNTLHGGAMLFYKFEDHNYDIDHDIDGCSALDAIEKDYMNGWRISHYSEHEGLSPSKYNWKPLTEPSFTADWRNSEFAIVNWAAHGAPSSIGRVIWDWDDGDGIPEHDNGELIWGRFLDTYSSLEGDYPSIVFAVSCNVGRPEPTPDGNLGIDLLTKESFGAAVAVCSATRGAAASVNFSMNHAGAEALCYEFNHYMIDGPDGPSEIGIALHDSKYYVHSNFGWDHYLEYQNMYVYNLYGDPSMRREGRNAGVPSVPEINGPVTGKPGIEYTYSFKSTDPFYSDIFYYIDWGDGNIKDWTGPYESGEEATYKHTYSDEGIYTISAKARNIYGADSDWGYLEVNIPKTRFRNWFFILKLFEFFNII
jgi:hypothetical protein